MPRWLIYILYALGTTTLAVSLPLVWYSDGGWNLRGIDGRYEHSALGAFLRMPVIAAAGGALIGATAALLRARALLWIAALLQLAGAFVIIVETLDLLASEVDVLSGRATTNYSIELGFYVAASGMLLIAAATVFSWTLGPDPPRHRG